MSDSVLDEDSCNSLFNDIATKSPQRFLLEPELAKLRECDIPLILKDVMNEAIYCHIFRAYAASIIMCRSFSELLLKYILVKWYRDRSDDNPNQFQGITKFVKRSTFSQLEKRCHRLDLLNKDDRERLCAIRVLGNVHVHNDSERRNKEYLQNDEIKESFAEHCRNLKMLGFLMEPHSFWMELTPEDAPKEVNDVSQVDLEWFAKEYPGDLKRKGEKDMSLFVLRQVFALTKSAFSKR